jgi:hypothetical protein
MVYGRLKTATGPSEKFEYRSPVDLGIGDAMYRRPVISIYAPSKAHHSPMVWCTPRRFEVKSSGSIGLVIHPVTSRLRTLGRAIGSCASTRLASETCCCSLMGRTNRLVALSSRPVLHRRRDDSCSSSRLALRRSRTTPIAETSRRSRMLSRPLWRCRRLRVATRPASPARTARNPRLGLAIHHNG